MSSNNDWQIVKSRKHNDSRSRKSFQQVSVVKTNTRKHQFVQNKREIIRKYKKVKGYLKFWLTSSWLLSDDVESNRMIVNSRLVELNASPADTVCNLRNCLTRILQKLNLADISSIDVYKKPDSSLRKFAVHHEISMIFYSLDANTNPITYGRIYTEKYEFIHLNFYNFLAIETGEYISDSLTQDIMEDWQNLQTYEMVEPKTTKDEFINRPFYGYENLLKIRNSLSGLEVVQVYNCTEDRNKKTNESNGNKQSKSRYNKHMKQSQYYEIYSDEQISMFKNTYECTINLLNAHAARATPIKENNLKSLCIDLMTRENCGYNTFQNDRVLVKINDHNTVTGKVIKVLESNHRPINGIFLCKVCRDKTNLMKPLDDSMSKIHVDNEPGVRKYESYLKNVKKSSNLREEQFSVTEKLIQSKEYANYKYVSIYSIGSVDKDRKTVEFSENTVIEVDPENCPYIFVVVYIDWSPYYMYPRGKVVGIINVTDSLLNYKLQLELIATICHVEPQLKPRQENMKYMLNEFRKFNEQSVIHDNILPSGAVIFTLDSETTRDIDDAISYHVDAKTHHQIVGVHISDVSHYLLPTSKIYERAKRQATTFYPSKNLNQEPIHMLNEQLSTDVFSLLPNKPRRVISIYFRFPADLEGKKTDLLLEKPFIREGCIISQYRLNYKDVAEIITRNEFNDDEEYEDFDNDIEEDDEVSDDENNYEKDEEFDDHLKDNENENFGFDEINKDLVFVIMKCFKISKKLRRLRLPHSYFVRSADIVKLDYRYSNDSAHFLIEEFMLLANKSVAERIYAQFPDNTLLRCQPPVSNFENWLNTIQKNLNLRYSGEINQLTKLLVGNPGNGNTRLPLTVSSTFYQKYHEFIKNNEFDLAKNMLSYDMFYNDFYVYLCDWYKLSHKSQYICSTANDKNGNRHFQLDMDHYTHFTSPIRRFTDIIVHRLLKQVLQIESVPNNSPLPVVNHEEIEEVCTNSNRSQAYSKLYEKYCESIGLFQPVTDSNGESNTFCFILDCVCSEISIDQISFVHPLLKKCSSKSSIRFSQLGGLDFVPVNIVLSNNAVPTERLTKCLLSWKRIIYTCWPLPEELNLQNRHSKVRTFEIPSNIYDAALNPDAYKVFNKIRRDYVKNKELTDSLQTLASNFHVHQNVKRITSDSDQLTNPIIEIKWEINIKNTVRVQFCRYNVNGLYKVMPELFIVCDTLQICLLHSENPIKCFVIGGELKMKYTEIKKEFDKLEDYKDYFLPLVEAESLSESLKEHVSLSLVNCEIHFFKSKYKVSDTNEIFGLIFLDEEFCKSCNILISDFSDVIYDRHDRIIEEAMDKHGSDLLCLRGKRSDWNNFWVGHGQVLSKESFGPPNKLLIVFLLTQLDFPVSTFDSKKVKFNVDFYKRSIVSRRQIQAISNIDSHPLAKSIIVEPNLQSCPSKNDEFLKEYCGQHQLNYKQSQAVRNAVSEELSLIWGPPGTGKTQIGCILSKVYCDLNMKNDAGSLNNFVTADEESEVESDENENSDCESEVEILNSSHVRSYYLKSSVILYCGPSNDCVDLVAKKMQSRYLKQCPKLLRIYGESQELADFPLPGIFIGNRYPLDGDMHKLSLHHLIRESNDTLKNFDDFFYSINQGDNHRWHQIYNDHFADQLNSNNSSDLPNVTPLNYSWRDIMHTMLIGYRIAINKAKMHLIKTGNFQMVLCTTTVSATKIMDNFNIRQVIIDEAGMCKEPETLIPIIAAEKSVEHIVLIGDHKQLRPIINNPMAKSRGLEISLFERYQSICPHLVTMLNAQYRMHPSICEFPSINFYYSKLKTFSSHLWSGIREDDIDGENEEKRHIYQNWNGVDYSKCVKHYQSLLEKSNYSIIPDVKWPGVRKKPYKCFNKEFNKYPERVVFINVIGDEISQPISTSSGSENSKANEAEVKVVKILYRNLLKRYKQAPRQAPSIVTVLTQYRLQQSKLLDACKDVITELGGRKIEPNVQTVIRSQGSENDYIIFSTVRSLRNDEDIIKKSSPGWEMKYLGFITDPNQINVALTRAKKGLIIVGNMKLLRVNSMWRKLISNLAERDCVLENVVDFKI